MYVCVYVCMYVRTYVCVYIYIYIYNIEREGGRERERERQRERHTHIKHYDLFPYYRSCRLSDLDALALRGLEGCAEVRLLSSYVSII